MLDATDSKALAALLTDARVSWADLGTALGLSPPAAAERVRKLQERGLVRGFAAVLDPDAAGFPVLAFVAVTLDRQDARRRFLDAVRSNPLIQECHHVAGDDDFLLKVRARTLAELDALLSEELKGRLGIARTRTTIVLGTAKETARLPIGKEPAPPTSGTAANRRGARPRR
jgi:Lrp/AsnC family transcriptional regulator, leucine-responsive regulatory protein